MRRLCLLLALAGAVCHGPLQAACSKAEFRLAIDIGHDVVNHGTTSARGEGEYWFNKRLAHRLLKTLRREGYHSAYILNDDDIVMPLYLRTREAGRKQADFLLSLHHDSAREFLLSEWQYNGVRGLQGDRFSGHSIFVSRRNPYWEESLSFATDLAHALLKDNLRPTLHHHGVGQRRIHDSTLGIYRYDPLIILHSARMPAVLFEGGVILNRDDELLLRSSRHQNRLIRGIQWALQEHLARGCRARDG